MDRRRRLELFDAATERQRGRDRKTKPRRRKAGADRGWTRQDLYDRGLPR